MMQEDTMTPTPFRTMEEQKQHVDIWLKYLEQDEIQCTKQLEDKRRELEGYDKLKLEITDLTKKLEKNIPVGRMAFLPGTLDRTNEFYTMIGDNHFVKKSSSRTVELLDRRQNVIREQVKKLDEELSLVKQRKNFADQLIKASSSEEIEIREPYDENVQTTRIPDVKPKVSNKEYEELMRRLDELDALEEEGEKEYEFDSDDMDEEELERLVKQQHPELAISEDKPVPQDSRDPQEPQEPQELRKTQGLSPDSEPKKAVRFNDHLLGPVNSSNVIQEVSMSEPSSSILKHTDHVPRIDRQAVEAMNRRENTQILPESTTAIKEAIVERDPLGVFQKDPVTNSNQPTVTQKQSRFKVQRKK